MIPSNPDDECRELYQQWRYDRDCGRTESISDYYQNDPIAAPHIDALSRMADADHRVCELLGIAEPPDILGYEIREKLGEGGMGVVWRAWDKDHNREVAIKVLRSGVSLTDEARRAGECSDALRVIPIFHSGTTQDGRGYIVMPIAGKTLEARWGSRKQAARDVARIGSEIAEAVQQLHNRGVIHRDLTPRNILKGGDFRFERVSDFGLSCPEGAADALPGGSRGYMAPETDRATVFADIYSIGAILYRGLTGAPPPEHVATQELPNPPTSNPCLAAIVMKCLQFKAQARYETARELATDLDRYLDGLPVAARPVGRIQRVWKTATARSNRLKTLIQGLTAIVIVVAVIAWWNAEKADWETALRKEAERAETAERALRQHSEISARFNATRASFEQAVRTRNEPRIESVEADLGKLLRESQDAMQQAEIHHLLGQIHRRRVRSRSIADEYARKAIWHYEQAISRAPDRDLPRTALAILYHDCKEFEKAIEVYDQLIKVKPRSLDAWGNKANSILEIAERKKALERKANPMVRAGLAMERQLIESEAQRCYVRALEIDDKFAAAYYNLGNLYFGRAGSAEEPHRQQLFRQAIEQYEAAQESVNAKRHPLHLLPSILKNKGNAHRRVGQRQPARESYAGALRRIEKDLSRYTSVAHAIYLFSLTESSSENALSFMKLASVLAPDNADLALQMAESAAVAASHLRENENQQKEFEDYAILLLKRAMKLRVPNVIRDCERNPNYRWLIERKSFRALKPR